MLLHQNMMICDDWRCYEVIEIIKGRKRKKESAVVQAVS